MTRVVHRYDLSRGRPEATVIPWTSTSRVLLVAQREPSDGLPNVWVEHDAGELDYPIDGRPLAYTVAVHGTGHPIPDDGRTHHGSAVCGPFVWHVYGWLSDGTPA